MLGRYALLCACWVALTAAPAAAQNDSCRYARDGQCDELPLGTGACGNRTDTTDCRSLEAGGDDSCRWSNDGQCDEPGIGTGICTSGQDASDCRGVAHLRNRDNSCRTAFNGICEERGHGDGSCARQSDTVDCLGRDTVPGIRDYYFGHDDRQALDSRSPPWSAIGQLEFASGSACTATMIAPAVALTAAHCFYFVAEGIDRPTEFLAGRSFNQTVARAGVRSFLIAPGYDAAAHGAGNKVDGHDWALVVLDRPIGETTGTLGIRRLTAEDLDRAAGDDWYPVLQAGYSWDAGERLTGHIGCHVQGFAADNTLRHDCDTTIGDSGSPIFIEIDGGHDIIAVDSRFGATADGQSSGIAVDSRAFAEAVDKFVSTLAD